jgi:MEDS: MEthanogen/methylotroph, DcmR Sensory domain/HicB family
MCAMETAGFRHQGFINHGLPSRHIPMVAAVMKARLEQKHRCLYFDNERRVAEVRSHLAQIGVDVARETANNSLVFTSDLDHLNGDQEFDTDRMIATLEEALKQTLRDGYVGLWASGDVAWELGPKVDCAQLFQYELRLEEFMCSHPEVSGICQYHASVLPLDAMRTGHEMHPSLFISETQSRLNPAFGATNSVSLASLQESIFDLSLPPDIRRRASAWADSQGITLNEFINRALVEKLDPAGQKNLKH